MNLRLFGNRNHLNNGETAGTLAEVRTYSDSAVQQAIDALSKPLTPDGREQFDEWIVSKGTLVAGAVVDATDQKFETVGARVETAGRALGRAEAALAAEAACAVSVPPVMYVRPVVAGLAFLTCLAAEYQITLTTIPWFLNMRETDFAAQALAAIGVAAVTGVEFGFSLLLAPYLNGTKTLETSKVFSAFVYTFAAATVAMNLFMVMLLADGREAAADAKHRSEERMAVALRPVATAPSPERLATSTQSQKATDTEKAKVNSLAVDRAIRALSVAACVDGGLFAVLLMTDLSLLLARNRNKKQTARFLKDRDRFSTEWETLKQTRAALEPEWKRREAKASQTAAECVSAYRAQLQLKLDDIERKEEMERKLEEQRRIEAEKKESDVQRQRRPLTESISATLAYELERNLPTAHA